MSEPISCQEALRRLYEYLDGELTPENAHEVRRHIELCQACYPEVKLTSDFHDAVRRAARGQPACPDSLREKVARLIAEEEAP